VTGEARGRMLREARAASALKHPSIVTVHDVGDHDGRDDGSPPELVHQLPLDRSSLAATIDDRGHPLVVVDSWSGELWLARPARGARW